MAGRVRQNLSSDSLFHFVNRREYLLDDLRNGFQARYSLETFPWINLPIGIPMKCFCDIPLGLAKRHISRYGRYGIGISKQFAKAHGITPVIYVHENSTTLKEYMLQIYTSSDSSSGLILQYFKKYEEDLSGQKHSVNIRYYDEREWRWVPYDPDFLYLKSKAQIEAKRRVEKANRELPHDKYRLNFDLDDIAYIFVQNDRDVPDVITEIRRIRRFKTKNLDLLIAKIITADQIQKDF